VSTFFVIDLVILLFGSVAIATAIPTDFNISCSLVCFDFLPLFCFVIISLLSRVSSSSVSFGFTIGFSFSFFGFVIEHSSPSILYSSLFEPTVYGLLKGHFNCSTDLSIYLSSTN